MKKAIKWIAIVAGILIVLLIVGAVALPFVIPLEKIKDFAVVRISEAISREVKIEKVSFNIFEGIKLEGLSISNRPGFAKKSFVSADAIVLRYAFWPLFKRQIIIKELRLVKPEVLIEKNAAGEFNFSDLTQKRAPAKKPEKKEPGFSVIIDVFSVRDGHIAYVDYGTKSSSEIKNADLTVSGITLALLKPLDLKFSGTAAYQKKVIPLSLAGKVGIDMANDTIKIPSLTLDVAGEKAAISANVSRLRAGPSIDFSISSRKLSVDPLLAIFAAGAPPKKEKTKRGELTQTINRATASLPRRLSLKGSIDIENLTFQEFKVDKAKLGLSLANKVVSADLKEIRVYEGMLSGKAVIDLNVSGLSYSLSDLKLSGFNAHHFSNAVVVTFLTRLPDYKDLVDKVYGTLDASLSLKGKGVEVPDIMANADASGSFSLKNGELKRLKTIDAIADKIKTAALKQDLKISELTGSFTFKNQVVDVKALSLKDTDINMKFKGGIDLGNLKFVSGNRLTLLGAPSLTRDLPREYTLMRNDQGWLEVTFELTGDLKKPLPALVLEKPLEKATEKLKLTIEAKKVEIEEAAKKKAEEEKKRLEEEAKKKLKEMIKF
jgi:uncharacterized protein involved in outer membrane biogenesis